MHNVPSPSACPGICNSGWRRAETARLNDATPHEYTPRAGDPVWCNPCVRHLHTELGNLPYMVAQLQLEVENATNAGHEQVSGSKERPIHERERYTICIEDIDGVLDSWAVLVRDERNLHVVRPARQGPRICASTTLLVTHFDWLTAEHPAAAEFGLEVRRVHLRAAALTHTSDVRPERCDGVICPRCDVMALEHELDWQGRATGYISCRNCGTLLSAAEYERWLKMLAAPLRGRLAA